MLSSRPSGLWRGLVRPPLWALRGPRGCLLSAASATLDSTLGCGFSNCRQDWGDSLRCLKLRAASPIGRVRRPPAPTPPRLPPCLCKDSQPAGTPVQSRPVQSRPVHLSSQPSLTLNAWHGQLSTPRCCLTFLFPRAWQQHNTARLQALVRLQHALTSQPATSAQHSSKRHGAARQGQPSSVQSNPAQPSQGKAYSVFGRIIRPCPRRPTSTRRSEAAVAENNKAHHIGKNCDCWPVKDKSTCWVHLQGAERGERRESLRILASAQGPPSRLNHSGKRRLCRSRLPWCPSPRSGGGTASLDWCPFLCVLSG